MSEQEVHTSVEHIEISYENAQGLQKNIANVSSSPPDGRLENKPSCHVRKTWHDIEQKGTIFEAHCHL